MASRYEVKLVGYANANCRFCHGIGRLGYLGKVEDGIVQPCPCVVFFESDRLKAEADGKQKQQRDSGPAPAQREEGDRIPGKP